MTTKEYDVFGIVSALMDFLLEVPADELVKLNLKKGHFNLIGEQESKKLLEYIKKHEVKIAPGGSSANTLYGVAILGGKAVFCGKVGKDDHGKTYKDIMFRNGVKPNLAT